MINPLDSSAQRFLIDLENIQARLQTAQRQISSGLRVSSPSDAPEQIGEILLSQARLGMTAQIEQDLGRVQAEVDTAEQALELAVKAVERALTLGEQGANATQTPESRRAIAAEVESLLAQMVTLANTRVAGRYIFSGDADQVPAYALDLNQPNGVTAYAGTEATRQVLHPAGTRFAVARSAQQIYDDPDASVFGALNALRKALLQGPAVPPDDPDYQNQLAAQTAAIDKALVALRKAHDHLNVQLGFYGAVQNQVSEALNFARRLQVREQNLLSTLRDADVAAAATALVQAVTHLQAALWARAQMPRGSLFDYLA